MSSFPDSSKRFTNCDFPLEVGPDIKAGKGCFHLGSMLKTDCLNLVHTHL